MLKKSFFELVASVLRAAAALVIPGIGPQVMLNLGLEKGHSQARIAKAIVRSPRLGIATALVAVAFLPGIGSKVLGVLWGAVVFAANHLVAMQLCERLGDEGWA